MSLNIDEQKAVDRFRQEVAEPSMTKLVILDFWAEWCQPCKMLAATIDEVADTYQGKAKIGKIDIDNNKEVAMKFNISAIPTVLIFKNGEIAKQFVGLTKKEDIVEAMDALV